MSDYKVSNMRLSKIQLRSIEPLRDDLGIPIEPPTIYAARVQHLLPNFPEPVLAQWFQDHSGVIEKHSGLDYLSLRFHLASIGPTELQLPCLAEHPTVVQYREYFLQGVFSYRMKRLAEYIEERHTWPIPPLVFDNPDGRFVASWGLKYSRPYDLLEGHHRMAVLYALGKHTQRSHQVWLVQR
jgi:hypothetical protein